LAHARFIRDFDLGYLTVEISSETFRGIANVQIYLSDMPRIEEFLKEVKVYPLTPCSLVISNQEKLELAARPQGSAGPLTLEIRVEDSNSNMARIGFEMDYPSIERFRTQFRKIINAELEAFELKTWR
jgi:hypothetical protein